MSIKIPKVEGYYWWTDGGEHTPTILKVTKEGGKFYAENNEYSFEVKKEKNCLWSVDPIPLPIIDGETVEPGSY